MTEAPGAFDEAEWVVLVTRNLPPLRGGMERLNLHMATELSAQFRVQVVGPSGCRDALPRTIAVQEVAVRPLWRFLMQALYESLRLAWEKKPRVVLAGSGLTAPLAVLAAWLSGGYSAVYAHGLDLIVNSGIYRRLWLPFLRRCDVCVVNSRNTAALAEQAGIPPDRIVVIHPGVALPPMSAEGCSVDFRLRHGLVDSQMLLSVGRLTRRKGLLEFVRHALPQIVAAHPDLVLVVIGDEAPDALSGAGIGAGEEIRACAKALALDRNVKLLGACSDEELSAAYDAADLCIFPVLDLPGDVEGFGMVAIEAAAHGLLTVGFDVGGVSDAVATGQSGWLVPSGDYTAMGDRVVQALSGGRTPAVRAEARRFAEMFEWQHFGTKLRGRLNLLIAGRGPRS